MFMTGLMGFPGLRNFICAFSVGGCGFFVLGILSSSCRLTGYIVGEASVGFCGS